MKINSSFVISSLFIGLTFSSCCDARKKHEVPKQAISIGSSKGNLVGNDSISHRQITIGVSKGQHIPEAYSDVVFIKREDKQVLARKKILGIFTEKFKNKDKE